MKKYIRTKDGRIIDVDAFIEILKNEKYYKDYVFDEIKNRDDGWRDECYIHWTAIGTEENNIDYQRGVRCDFEYGIVSPFIEQADTIEELCDEFVLANGSGHKDIFINFDGLMCKRGNDDLSLDLNDIKNEALDDDFTIFGAIWTNWGLKYVAKLNLDTQKLELLEIARVDIDCVGDDDCMDDDE